MWLWITGMIIIIASAVAIHMLDWCFQASRHSFNYMSADVLFTPTGVYHSWKSPAWWLFDFDQ